MARYVLRAWLADRPGALGALASALGEVGADLIGIDILERDAMRVVDELTVNVPDSVGVSELARGVAGVADVQIEDIRPVVDRLAYPGSDPLDLAVGLGEARSPGDLAESLAHGVAAVFAGDWAAVVRGDDDLQIVTAGQAPPAGWLRAFVSGASSQVVTTSGELCGPRDVAWALLDQAGASAVVGRGGPPFRSKERHQLTQLCRIADGRWRELVLRAGMAAHPSTGLLPRSHSTAAAS